MTHFDATYLEDHLYLLELSSLLEPKSQYSFDYTFQSIDHELSNYEQWDTDIDGPTPIPTEEHDHAPQNWYTQYWLNCAHQNICAEFNENELRELCDYTFDDDCTIYTGDFLDEY